MRPALPAPTTPPAACGASMACGAALRASRASPSAAPVSSSPSPRAALRCAALAGRQRAVVQGRMQRGFTLLELVMVIVILGVVGTMVAVFMQAPITAYLASSQRAALADEADTAARRIQRDLRSALPNSIRISTTAGEACLEFIPTRTGGRYRANDRTPGDGTGLDFAAPDQRFNVLGNNPAGAQQIGPGDLVAVYNLGIPGADAYAGDTIAVVDTVAASPPDETTITLTAPRQFALESGSSRFQVVPAQERVVAYVCTGGTLRRLATATAALNNSATHYCGTPAALAAAPMLANNLNACAFSQEGGNLQSYSLVQVSLGLTQGGEVVNLVHHIAVNNTP